MALFPPPKPPRQTPEKEKVPLSLP
jgi:hypothetical protein